MRATSTRWRSIAGYGVLAGASMGMTVGVTDAVMNVRGAWLAGVAACLGGGVVSAFAQWRRLARAR